MIISDEQARAAADYLREHHDAVARGCQDVSQETLQRARAAVSAAPDTRPDRIEEARARLAMPVDASDVAAKMLSRIVSDSLR